MEWANPAEKRACKNSSTVPNGQLTGSSWRSPHHESQLQGVQFPHWGSSRLEDGLSNLSWETRGYELCPLRGHTHSFHNSNQGWKIMPSAGEMRALLTGIPHGEPSRREIRSENHTQPGQNGVIAIDGPHPGAFSLELLWAERFGKGIQTKPLQSLYHDLEITRGDSAMSVCIPTHLM